MSALRVNKSCGCYNRDSKETGYKEINGTYWSSVYHGASYRNLEFAITIQDAWNQYEKQSRLCALSGVPVWFTGKRARDQQTASLDRIDSELGYTVTNIQVVHKDINMLKGLLSNQDVVDWSRLISYCSEGST